MSSAGTRARLTVRSRRVVFLVALFLLGVGVNSTHSHADGPGATPTCTICHVAESDWTPSAPAATLVLLNPAVRFTEGSHPPALHACRTVEAKRARSPPSRAFSKA